MSLDGDNLNPELARQWNALLDGELDADEEARLRALPGAEAFLADQARFNDALKSALGKGAAAPAGLEERVKDAVQRESSGDASTEDSAEPRFETRMLSLPLWRVSAAAVILVIMSIAGTLVVTDSLRELGGTLSAGISADAGSEAGEMVVVNELMEKASSSVFWMGPVDEGAIRERFATVSANHQDMAISYDTVPVGSKVFGCDMAPINIEVGTTRSGQNWRAITYCAGNIADNPSAEGYTPGESGGGRLLRCVLFIVDGKVLPEDWKPCAKGMVSFCNKSSTVVGKFDAKSNQTFLVFTMGIDQPEAIKLSEPILSL